MKRRVMMGKKKLQLFTKRFFPAGTYTWVVPAGCTEVDVFLVGAGGGCGFTNQWGAWGGGGGGYTKSFRGRGYVKPSSGTWMGTYDDGRDGNAIAVVPGQQIQIIVGAGVAGGTGGFSEFMNSSYRAEGGKAGGYWATGGSGGSGGSTSEDEGLNSNGGSDGSDGYGEINGPGSGQGHTTRDFGESTGKRNAGGGSSIYNDNYPQPFGGISDYNEGTGEYYENTNTDQPCFHSGFPGGGYGGGAGPTIDTSWSSGWKATKGGDGTVLIRYWAYEE